MGTQQGCEHQEAIGNWVRKANAEYISLLSANTLGPFGKSK
jgi:hypothetical protein